MAVVSLAVFVRNGYGMMWLTGFIALNVVVLLWGNKTITKWYYLVLAFLTLEESVSGALYILILALNRPGQAGDASLLAQASGIPAPVWGVWFILFALWCAKRALQSFFGKRRSRPGDREMANAYSGYERR
ncbi:hypothetical protein D3C87_1445520 [compost metagenome]